MRSGVVLSGNQARERFYGQSDMMVIFKQLTGVSKNVGDLLRRAAAFYFLPVSLLCACAFVGVVSPQSKAKAQAAAVSNCDSEEATAQIKITNAVK